MEPVVDCVVRPAKIERQEDELLGAGTVRRFFAARLREIPAVLDLVDESTDVVLHRSPRPEAHLLGPDEMLLLGDEGEPGQDQPLSELGDVAREGDRAVTGHHSFPAFGIGMIEALLHSLGTIPSLQDALMLLSRARWASGPRCRRCSLQMPSGPGAFFICRLLRSVVYNV